MSKLRQKKRKKKTLIIMKAIHSVASVHPSATVQEKGTVHHRNKQVKGTVAYQSEQTEDYEDIYLILCKSQHKDTIATNSRRPAIITMNVHLVIYTCTCTFSCALFEIPTANSLRNYFLNACKLLQHSHGMWQFYCRFNILRLFRITRKWYYKWKPNIRSNFTS